MPQNKNNDIQIVKAEEVMHGKHLRMIQPEGYSPRVALDNARLTKDAISFAMGECREWLDIYSKQGNHAMVDRLLKMSQGYWDMLNQFVAFQSNITVQVARLAYEKDMPMISEITKALALPEGITAEDFNVPLAIAQNAMEQGAKEGMNPRQVLDFQKETMCRLNENGEVEYNPKREIFYANMSMASRKKLDIEICGLLQSGKRPIAIKKTIDFFNENPLYSTVVAKVDRFKVLKECKDKAKSEFLNRDPKALDPIAHKLNGAEGNVEGYWLTLSEEERNKTVLKYLNEQIDGSSRLNILVDKELEILANRYIDTIKEYKSVKELIGQPGGFSVLITVGDHEGNGSTLVGIRITPTKVLFNKEDVEGYVTYPSEKDLINQVSSTFLSIAGQYLKMTQPKIHSFETIMNFDGPGFTEEVSKYLYSLGVWLNEIRLIDFKAIASKIDEKTELDLIDKIAYKNYAKEIDEEYKKS